MLSSITINDNFISCKSFVCTQLNDSQYWLYIVLIICLHTVKLLPVLHTIIIVYLVNHSFAHS